MAGIGDDRDKRNKAIEAQSEEIKKAVERELKKRKLAVYKGNTPSFHVRCDRSGSGWRMNSTGTIRVQISHGREMKQFISKKDGSGIDVMAVVDFMAAVKEQKDADDAREKELRRLTAEMEPIAKKIRKHFGLSEYGAINLRVEHGGRLKLCVNVEVTPEKARETLDALEGVGFMKEEAPEVKDDEVQ
jgi:hypothetical protein